MDCSYGREEYRWEQYIREVTNDHLLQVRVGPHGSKAMWKRMYPKDPQKGLQEAKQLFRISHPNVIRIIDVYGEDEIALVGDYIEGELTLQDELIARVRAKQFMREKDVMRYFTQIVLAFKELHGIGALHRKVDASHFIFYNCPGTGRILKMASFGFDRLMYVAEEQNWRHKAVEQKWPQHGAYLPPEFTPRIDAFGIGPSQPYDVTCDVFGLGILLY